MSAGDPESASVTLHTGSEAVGFVDAIWPCWNAVFGEVEYAAWRTDVFERHAARADYRLAVGRVAQQVVGFSWGYTGERGQYWPDLVHQALTPELAAEWVGGHFEFVELAVRTEYRRQGLGLRLHDSVLEGVRGRCLLGTSADPADPAVRLYLRSGWTPLGPLGPRTQVMGRRI